MRRFLMRRMRDLTAVHYVAITVPGLVAVFGIQHLIRHRSASHADVATVKTSQYKQDSKGSRKVASSAGDKDRDRLARGSTVQSDQEESTVASSHGAHVANAAHDDKAAIVEN